MAFGNVFTYTPRSRSSGVRHSKDFMQANDFMDVETHFSQLLSQLPTHQQRSFANFKHTRVETAFRKRHFIVYQMDGGHPHEHDRVVVNDFRADDEHGTTTELIQQSTGDTLLVGYSPVQLFTFPIFVWLPLHSKLRWGAPAEAVNEGSLGFPLCIRTESRLGLRENGICYCETGVSYGKEFDGTTVN